ncbi:ATP-binding protein [Spirosoma soli]
MGKTLFLQKFAYLSIMNDEPNKAIYFMFQGTPNVQSLTDVILNELRSKGRHGWLSVGMHRCHELYNKLTGTKTSLKYNDVEFSFTLPQFETEWEAAFRACIEDLADRQADKGERLTLIFDELPIMLWEWISTGKAADAMAFLDLLRNIHYSLKDSDRIRFVFCGSIGMKVVLGKLKKDHRYTGEPLNYTVEYHLPPMSGNDAIFLCECLYLSDFECDIADNRTTYFQQITEACNNLPYFINAVFSICRTKHDGLLSAKTIEEAVKAILTDTGSAYDIFKQLDERLTTYYSSDQTKAMYGCLKLLAKAQEPMSEEALKTQLSFDEHETQNALNTLWQDELLARTFDENDTRHFAFKYSLIKRWWKLNKA